ncbi:hypothetical protein EDB83DRAFT_2366361 [Lactarius deliciosus]|nr:hypothetical protein EDB83DRAFT_2366361 [Lactarius deliciosus]
MVQWFLPSPPTLFGRAWVEPLGSTLASAIFLTGALFTTPGLPVRHTSPPNPNASYPGSLPTHASTFTPDFTLRTPHHSLPTPN